MKKEFLHELTEPFKYSHNGEFHNADVIGVKAPKGSNDFFENLQFLDSLCNKAEMRSMKNIAGVLKELELTEEQKEKAQETNSNKTEEEKALDAYNQLLAGLEREEIKQLNICIIELLKKSAVVDGEKKFEASFWDGEDCLDDYDKRLLIGKYIENFTVTAQRNSKKQS